MICWDAQYCTGLCECVMNGIIGVCAVVCGTRMYWYVMICAVLCWVVLLCLIWFHIVMGGIV